MTPQSLEETETALTQSADNRGEWHVFSEDIVFQRKMERLGIQPTYISKDGLTKEYTLTSDNISFKKGKVELSPEEKERRSIRMKEVQRKRSEFIAQKRL